MNFKSRSNLAPYQQKKIKLYNPLYTFAVIIPQFASQAS